VNNLSLAFMTQKQLTNALSSMSIEAIFAWTLIATKSVLAYCTFATCYSAICTFIDVCEI
jgi:hypothetical protein